MVNMNIEVILKERIKKFVESEDMQKKIDELTDDVLNSIRETIREQIIDILCGIQTTSTITIPYMPNPPFTPLFNDPICNINNGQNGEIIREFNSINTLE